MRHPSELNSARISRRLIMAQGLCAAWPAGALARGAQQTPLQIVAAAGVALSGVYPGHLQGVCANGRDAIYWSMTTRIVKTDASGNIVKSVRVANHHGDLCHLDGRIYVAVNLALFNDPQQRADSWIYVYDADSLDLLSKTKIDELVFGAGGIAFGEDRFVVVGGLPEGAAGNHVYEYDRGLRFIRRTPLPGGYTYKGVQTAAYHADHWWFGCYAKPDFSEVLIRTDRAFGAAQTFRFDASKGITPLDQDTFLVAQAVCGKESCVARLAPVKLDRWIATGALRPL